MSKTLTLNDFFRNTDLNLCCTLVYFSHFLEAVDKADPARCIFIIKRDETTDKIVEDFHKGHILVEPKRFCAIQKEIKGRIYNT